MKALRPMIRRNVKLYFKDKGMFFTSLITPLILLVLYATFLSNVYKDSFVMNLPAGMTLPEQLLEGMAAGQLVSSLLATSCVTVGFCSNFLMVQDKANGCIRDLRITPVKPSTLSLSYYLATLLSTLLICLLALGICLVYTACVGWYMTVADVALLCLDVVLLVLFGTALSSVINFFLSTQGQISAVGSIISSCYGFICGAYMPISSFGTGLQKVLSFLPSTYATSLIRNHAMAGTLSELSALGVPREAVDGLRNAVDCNVYFFDTQVEPGAMYAYLGIATAVLVGVYVLLNLRKKKL